MSGNCLGGSMSDESCSLEEESFWGDGESIIISDDHSDGSESLFSINLRKYADYLEIMFPLWRSNHFMEDE